jgi:hypothetical protein
MALVWPQYGLDYLAVTFTNSSVTVGSVASATPITVHVELKNEAKRAGSKVVQVYFSPPVSPSRLTRYRTHRYRSSPRFFCVGARSD